MSQYSDPDSTRMETAVEYDEGVMDDRDAVRKGIWYQVLGIVEYMQDERLPTEDQRLQKRVALRMPFLGEQPREEWVKELELLAWRELWLEDAYQALWWYGAQYLPRTAEHDKPEGEEFDGPGLLWETFSELEFGSPKQARFHDLLEWRESRYDWDDTHEIEQDLVHLVTREMELEQGYQQLFHASEKAQQDSKVTDPVSIPQRQCELQGIGSPVSIPQRQCEMQGEESSVLPPQQQAELQGAEVVVPAPQQQHDFLGIGSPVSIPQRQAELQGAETVGPVPQRQSVQQGIESPVSFPQQQDTVLGAETVGRPPQRLEVCIGEELVTPSPQRQLNAPGGDSKPHNSTDGTDVSALTAQGVETVGLPLQQPGSNQASSVVALAPGQSTADTCPQSNLHSKPGSNTATGSTSFQHNLGGLTGQRQATKVNRSSIWLWVGCQTNSGTDRREVRYLVSLPWGGEMCGETNLATGLWRGLAAGLLPQDYGPYHQPMQNLSSMAIELYVCGLSTIQ